MTPREGLAAVLAVVIGLWWYTVSQRRQGALAAELRQNAVHIAVLDSALKLERAKFRADTVTVFRRVTSTVTRLDTLVQSDTLRLTDTVKVTVEVVREAVETLNACRATIRECGALRAREQARGDSLDARVKLLEKARPSIFSRCGLSVGYGATDKGFGPAVVAGCKIAP